MRIFNTSTWRPPPRDGHLRHGRQDPPQEKQSGDRGHRRGGEHAELGHLVRGPSPKARRRHEKRHGKADAAQEAGAPDRLQPVPAGSSDHRAFTASQAAPTMPSGLPTTKPAKAPSETGARK